MGRDASVGAGLQPCSTALAARDAREAAVRQALAEQGAHSPLSVVTISLNLPGSARHLPGCATLFAAGAAALEAAVGREGAVLRSASAEKRSTNDALGPFGVWHAALDAPVVKRLGVALEHDVPGGRLLDVDVYDGDGRQVGRAAFGLPPRRCFLCAEPAHDCGRLARHAAEDLARVVQALLAHAFRAALAAALVNGAREELALTPKPGLVDRLDNGSHPDLTFESMSRSVDLLPAYFAELTSLAGDRGHPPDLGACIDAGRRAEQRMLAEIGSNAHRGYIFLGGLLLLAGAGEVVQDTAEYRGRLRALASLVLGTNRQPPGWSHGSRLRGLHGLSGIHGEALAGLPAVFEAGLPALSRALDAGLGREPASHYAMAVLMQQVEDTTAVHRCGLAGLRRLHEDGERIQATIESGADALPLLAGLNDEYRATGLTMGGVADCLAATLALKGSGLVLPDHESI